MPENISLTPEEVAELLKISKYTVYEMIKRGEIRSYRIGRKVRIDLKDLENFKEHSKVNSRISAKKQMEDEQGTPSFVICGQDISLDILARQIEHDYPSFRVLRSNAGSIDSLLALYKGEIDVASAHLWDFETNQYNLPYVKYLLPGENVVIINLLYRMQGFIVAKGNPEGITGWQDLTRSGLRYMNREKGSGTRVLLDEKVKELGISTNDITGYDFIENSHLGVASAIFKGEADFGLGIETAARTLNLDFVPLMKERYDLVVTKKFYSDPRMAALMSVIRSDQFFSEIALLGNYSLIHCGKVIGEI